MFAVAQNDAQLENYKNNEFGVGEIKIKYK